MSNRRLLPSELRRSEVVTARDFYMKTHLHIFVLWAALHQRKCEIVQVAQKKKKTYLATESVRIKFHPSCKIFQGLRSVLTLPKQSRMTVSLHRTSALGGMKTRDVSVRERETLAAVCLPGALLHPLPTPTNQLSFACCDSPVQTNTTIHHI